MRGNRGSRGIPVPSVWQLLVVAAAVCAGWLIWSEFRGMGNDSSVKEGAGEVPAETALNSLRSIEALAERGPEGIAELVKSLGDSNSRVRGYALWVLRRLGPQASEALDPICERLADENANVREYAVDAYWHIRRDANAVAQVVVPRLGDDEERVRIAAAKVLERIGPPALSLVLEMLQCDSDTARVTALKVLRWIGWDRSRSDIDDAVRKLTGDDDPEVRAAALLTLVRWGQPLPCEIRELLTQPIPIYMGPTGPDSEPGSQETALGAIIRLGPNAGENLPDVLALFDKKPDSPDELLRMALEAPGANNTLRFAAYVAYAQRNMALGALRSMKTAALPAAPRLLELFDESKGSYRWEIAWTLLEIGADRQEIIGRLIPVLLGTDMEDCRNAGWLLAYASPEEGRRQVTALIPKLSPEQLAQHPSALFAVLGLARVAQEAVPSSLTVLLQQPLNDDHLRSLIDTLGEIGPDAAWAVPVLIGLLARDPSTLNIWHRFAILGSLGTMGSAARPAVPALLSELKTIKTHHNSTQDDKNAQAHCLATVIKALALVGGKDPEVLAALRTQLTSDDAAASRMALDALLQLSPESPDLLTELLIRCSNYPERAGWIIAISRMTCDRQEAIGPLTEALREGDPEIRKLAAWALGTLGSDARAALPALHDALSDWQNSLYKPRFAMRVSHDNSIRDEIHGRSRRSTIWHSVFETHFEELIQFEAPSVRDLVREAILKIDPTADFQQR